ncbi:WhiB family transcriptional regulator [Cryobacterium sp. PH31-O1]|uniref:WhiB family transcriptional regulator n=1 Tax=Cryobacterium sp. PH31-O1 TaxID=3046306 RepID=UPI0024BB1EA5|nr:WhiB family transcriptional regulator [Cryobacterium sp. PH31-O1]MDJ0337441.1 WhiB family transcriptional regulator [Cryobacterium sp. PH31-O1]
MTWREAANCATSDPDAFFPSVGGSMKGPAKVCAECTVVADCLAFAESHESTRDYGIFGGLSVIERRALRKARGVAA